MGVNRTGMKSLDGLARDKRIKEIWSEGRDGYFASLSDGYEAEGCGTIRADTIKELRERMLVVQEGERY